jgi:hypothetical protein
MRDCVRIAPRHDAAMTASNAERRFAPSIQAPCQSSCRRYDVSFTYGCLIPSEPRYHARDTTTLATCPSTARSRSILPPRFFPRTILRTPGLKRAGTHLVDEACCEARIVCREKMRARKNRHSVNAGASISKSCFMMAA